MEQQGALVLLVLVVMLAAVAVVLAVLGSILALEGLGWVGPQLLEFITEPVVEVLVVTTRLGDKAVAMEMLDQGVMDQAVTTLLVLIALLVQVLLPVAVLIIMGLVAGGRLFRPQALEDLA